MKNSYKMIPFLSLLLTSISLNGYAGGDDDIDNGNKTVPKNTQMRQNYQQQRYYGFNFSLGTLNAMNHGGNEVLGPQNPECEQSYLGSMANRAGEAFYNWVRTERVLYKVSGKLTAEASNGMGKEVYYQSNFDNNEKQVGYNNTYVRPETKIQKNIGKFGSVENKATVVVHLGNLSQQDAEKIMGGHDISAHELRNDVAFAGPSIRLPLASIAPISEERTMADKDGMSVRMGYGVRIKPLASNNVNIDVLSQHTADDSSFHVKAKVNIPLINFKVGAEQQFHLKQQVIPDDEILSRLHETTKEFIMN